jgi:hypothetical protein
VKRILLRLVVAVGALALLGACGRSIGDDCQTSVDCSANGDRSCDLSQPGGYCTVEGCDDASCPDSAVCVRFFPERFLSKPCDPLCEDVKEMTCTQPVPTNDCAPDELCLDVGLCARRASERRLCGKACSSNDDCRGGYECRPANTRGSMPLLSNPNGTAKFCAPRTTT